MTARLPPLNALRMFESAARHLSFTRAAADLNVTQAAVSQQIKALEDHLGLALFRRLNRRLLLTDAGQEYAQEVRLALEAIQAATDRLKADPDGGILLFSTTPSFAHKWLLPRLGGLIDRYPGISLRLHTTYDVVDLGGGAGRPHCAVRGASSRPASVFSELLFEEEVFPVCTPEMAAPLVSPADLKRCRLLIDEGVDWVRWFRRAGEEPPDLSDAPVFLDTSMALQAAMDGRGVTLGRTAMVAEDLAAGRLVAPFDIRIPWDFAYWFVCPNGHQDKPRIAALRHWLKEQASAVERPRTAVGVDDDGGPARMFFS